MPFKTCHDFLTPPSPRHRFRQSTPDPSTSSSCAPFHGLLHSRNKVYVILRQPLTLLCHRLASYNDNFLIVCRLHLNFIPSSSIPSFHAEFCIPKDSSSFSSSQSMDFNICFQRHGLHLFVLKPLLASIQSSHVDYFLE